MRRFVPTVALALLAAACSSEPMLASDLDPTTTTTSTATTAPTTTVMQVTTTSEEVGTNVSDILRIAYDELLEFDSVNFASHTDTQAGALGDARGSIAGRWNRDGTSELQIAVALDDRAVDVVELAVREDPAELAEAIATLATGISYRFTADGFAWITAGAGQKWQGGPKESLPGALELEASTDAALYLDSLFTSIVEVSPDPDTDASGNETYALVLDADIIVPALAPASTAGNLYDNGYDGVSEELTDGSITLDADGALIAAFVDQTPWWVAGWNTVGIGGVTEGATVEWAIGVSASSEQRPVVVPCDAPTNVFDADLGIDLLECA